MAWELKKEGTLVPPLIEEAKEALKKQYPEIFYELYKEV